VLAAEPPSLLVTGNRKQRRQDDADQHEIALLSSDYLICSATIPLNLNSRYVPFV
jgi:hypothetical protein